MYQNQDEDHFPDCLGLALIKDIPRNNDNYNIWLAETRKDFALVEQDIHAIYNLEKAKAAKLYKRPKLRPDRGLNSLSSTLGLYRSPTPFTPQGQDDDWIYLLNLENEEFVICGNGSRYRFALNDIDRAFCRQFCEYNTKVPSSELFLGIDTEHAILACLDLHDYSFEQEDLSFFSDTLHTNRLRRGVQSGIKFTQAIYTMWSGSPKILSIIERRVSVRDKAFREACYVVLCLALALPKDGYRSLYTTISFSDCAPDGLFDGRFLGKQRDGLITTMGSPWNVEQGPTWLCPEKFIFKARNLRVLPCPGIEYPRVAKVALAYMVEHARDRRIYPFYGVILSIKMVILIKVEHQTVRTSGPFPFEVDGTAFGSEREVSGFVALVAFNESAELDR
jgi:hypothetical protein